MAKQVNKLQDFKLHPAKGYSSLSNIKDTTSITSFPFMGDPTPSLGYPCKFSFSNSLLVPIIYIPR